MKLQLKKLSTRGRDSSRLWRLGCCEVVGWLNLVESLIYQIFTLAEVTVQNYKFTAIKEILKD